MWPVQGTVTAAFAAAVPLIGSDAGLIVHVAPLAAPPGICPGKLLARSLIFAGRSPNDQDHHEDADSSQSVNHTPAKFLPGRLTFDLF